MNRTALNLLAASILAAAVAAAQQGPRGPAGPGTPGGPGSPGNGVHTNAGLDMTRQQTVEGAISSVQIATGAQYPSIVINNTSIKVAPAWYLLENDFELVAGEAVKVTAAPSTAAADPYLHAVEITKTATGARITLRTPAGVPLWMGAARRGGNPQAPRSGGGCIDPATIKTVTGTIDRVTAGAGIQHPTLALSVGGSLITLKLGPERVLLDADIELNPGGTITVKYALAACSGELLALQINSLVLRHDDGTPAWND